MRVGCFTSLPRCALALALVGTLAVALGAIPADAQDDEEAEGPLRRPGIAARYYAEDESEPRITRLDDRPALLLGPHEAPDPRLPSRAWRVEWQGVLEVLRPGTYRFAVRRTGEVDLRIGGQPVPLPADEAAGKPVDLAFGLHPLELAFVPAATEGDAELSLFWESDSFPREPLPAHAVGHVAGEGVSPDLFPAGQLAAEEHSCTACHAPSDTASLSRSLATRPGPRLTDGGARFRAVWAYHWLADPQALRPEAVMPRLFSDDRRGEIERYAVATYLASLGGPIQGGDERDEAAAAALSDLGGQLFERTGCVVCHERQGDRPSRASLRGLGQKTTAEVLAAFIREPAAIDPSGRMPGFPRLSEDQALALGVYLSRRDAAEVKPLFVTGQPRPSELEALLLAPDAGPQEVQEFKGQSTDERLAALARRVMTEKRCTACHEMKLPGEEDFWRPRPAQADFSAIASKRSGGCLAAGDDASAPARDVPRFGPSLDRLSLRAFLHTACDAPGTSAPAASAALTLERFNCLGCHERNGRGGLHPDLLARLLVGQAPESAEQVAPPPLTGAADRLLESYLRQVLVEGRRSRTWMELAMPHFGPQHMEGLPRGLAALDGSRPSDGGPATNPEPALAEAGRALVGSKGFGCTKCHDMLGVESRGTRGPELSLIATRVRYDWYLRWMTDPQRILPGTRMPTVFLQGQSPHPQILAGDPNRQRRAIWHYLAASRDLPPPEGLHDLPPASIDEGDRPLVFRTFLPGVTPRAAAIRFPNRVHLAYDLQACRLAYAWTGDFLDTNPVWGGRGGSRAGLKGPVAWTAPEGFPWDVTASEGSPPSFAGRGTNTALGAELPDDGRLHPVRLRFAGYSIKERAPAFRYRLALEGGAQAHFVERVESLHDEAGAGALRDAQVAAPAGSTVWLQAAAADGPVAWQAPDGRSDKLEAAGATAPVEALVRVGQQGRPLVLRLRAASPGAEWFLAVEGDQRRLLVRIPAAGDPAGATLTLALWAVNDDAEATRKAIEEVEWTVSSR
jgi:cbb3-type cytochrome oxidase cytochrome c subunit